MKTRIYKFKNGSLIQFRLSSNNDLPDPDDDYDDDEPEDEICGYECMCCGTTFDEEDCSEGDPCPVCGAMALSAIYF